MGLFIYLVFANFVFNLRLDTKLRFFFIVIETWVFYHAVNILTLQLNLKSVITQGKNPKFLYIPAQ